ncbi:hypothetical protein BSZ36_12990 [Rubricoccus marinus]|uniref:RNA polymerase sigma factor 70 region 4 type 2 domain-containing protein n=2 Tax=Rubricoccus marinus TaxID=716817 RepID=A0A259U3Y6_9BACT|nr:hypothetical protein BSZ36_12990 [Rubricoccus marinus]
MANAGRGPAPEAHDAASGETAARIRDGDGQAFRRFFDATHAGLLGSLRRRGLDAPEAEDVAQQAYVWIWEHRAEIDPARSLRGLLFRIGFSRGLNALRDGARTEPLADRRPEDLLPDPLASGDPAEIADLRQRLAEAVAALPERRRQTFTLCFTDGLTHREAAEVMGVSPKTVEHQMAAALAAIRQRLAPFLETPGKNPRSNRGTPTPGV